MLKKLLSSALALSMCLSTIPFASATNQDDTEPLYYMYYDMDGNLISYDMPFSLEAPIAEDHTYLVKTLEVENEVFEYQSYGYHPDTPAWSKVASYTFSKTTTVEISGTFPVTIKAKTYTFNASFGIAASYSSGFSVTVEANQNYQSRIEVFCGHEGDIYRYEIRDEYTDEVLSTFRTIELRMTDCDFVPVYKDGLQHPVN